VSRSSTADKGSQEQLPIRRDIARAYLALDAPERRSFCAIVTHLIRRNSRVLAAFPSRSSDTLVPTTWSRWSSSRLSAEAATSESLSRIKTLREFIQFNRIGPLARTDYGSCASPAVLCSAILVGKFMGLSTLERSQSHARLLSGGQRSHVGMKVVAERCQCICEPRRICPDATWKPSFL
jgi:hypothetical protein